MPKLKEGRLRIGLNGIMYLLPNDRDLISSFMDRTEELENPMEKGLWRTTKGIYMKDYEPYAVDDLYSLRVIIEPESNEVESKSVIRRKALQQK